jgi:tRNA dimethylallyltransferase
LSLEGVRAGGVALVGTTASGKSDLAVAVARRLGQVELVSMDSMSVYREMDLATAKPSPALRAEVPHHLVDVADPSEDYSLARFAGEARRALEGIAVRGGRALLVGGTGLYVRTVVDQLSLPGRWPDVAAELDARADRPGGLPELHRRLTTLDPVAAGRIEPTNRRRVVRALEVTLGSGRPFSSFGPGLQAYGPTPFAIIGVPFDPPAVDRRIAERFDGWLAAGLVEEVRHLAGRTGGLSRTARQALGYRELLAHVESGVPLERCVADAVRATRRFARRQWAWFRRDPRIRWLRVDEDREATLLAALVATGGSPGAPAVLGAAR